MLQNRFDISVKMTIIRLMDIVIYAIFFVLALAILIGVFTIARRGRLIKLKIRKRR
jgi:hypothetical protein